MSRYILIDTDMAFGSPHADVDDALAILTAFCLELDVKAITSTGGNVSADKASRNTNLLLKRIGRSDVKTSYSSANPIDPYKWLFKRWNKSSESFVERQDVGGLCSSVDLIKDTIDKYGNITIVSLGPMTNIAVFLTLYPEYTDRIEAIYSMGGSVCTTGIEGRNIEFNIKADPESAAIVFSSNIPIKLFPLDVTKKKRIYPETIAKWAEFDGLINEFYKCSVSFMEYRAKRDGYTPSYAFYHDVLPIVSLVRPDFFVFRRCSISVELNNSATRGTTLFYFGSGNCEVALDISFDDLFAFVEGHIFRVYGGCNEGNI